MPTIQLPKLNLPEQVLKVELDNGDNLAIFDCVRQKRVALTPEEWVRQNFVSHLINELHYPKGLIANEVGLVLNDTRRRCDTVVYSREGNPLMIIEYKAPSIDIDQKVFDQILRYNIALHVEYLIVSNGLRHYCCRIDYNIKKCRFLTEIPAYENL